MKNKIITLIMAMVVTLSASFSAVAGNKPYCMHDGFGYVWHMTYHKVGYKHWTISGTVDVNYATWNITSGDHNKVANTFTITATNPAGDGCYYAVDYFTYTGSKAGHSYGGSWTNDCGSYGTWTATIAKGVCVGPQGGSNLPGPGTKGFSGAGSITLKDGVDIPELESDVEVISAAPNPFSNSTTISYSVYEAGQVNVAIYNTMGQLVATLQSANQEEGDYTITWNGANSKGDALPNGTYICRVFTNNDSQTTTLTLMK